MREAYRGEGALGARLSATAVPSYVLRATFYAVRRQPRAESREPPLTSAVPRVVVRPGQSRAVGRLREVGVHHPPEDARVEAATGGVARRARGDRAGGAEAEPSRLRLRPSRTLARRRRADRDVLVPARGRERHAPIQ